VLLCNTDENPEKQRSYLRVLAAERVLGVILAPSDPEAEEVGELLDLGIPVVAFDRQVRDARADSVTADNFNAGRQAARHLLDEGYERIAFVSSSGVQTVRDRQLGYEEVMRSAGLAPRSVPGLPRIEGGMATTQRLLEDPNPPDALIAANGLMALGALKTLRAHHVSIPQDVALVAFDDSVWSNLVDPPLTVLAQPVKRMAETAVEFLAERLAGGREEPRHAIFDLELRIRSSSAPTR
jgi:DNA-binding LacI/PurR family transcriptional regulator